MDHTEHKETQSDSDFEAMMKARLDANFSGAQKAPTVSDDRLREMNKRLPAWSLEPPYNFLK